MENNVSCQSKKKNKPGNLTVIQNPSKSIGKTTFPAPRKEGGREGNAGAPRADHRNLPNALWKSLGKQWFLHVRVGGTWLIQRAPFERHGKSYGYSKSFEKHWKNMVSKGCVEWWFLNKAIGKHSFQRLAGERFQNKKQDPIWWFRAAELISVYVICPPTEARDMSTH